MLPLLRKYKQVSLFLNYLNFQAKDDNLLLLLDFVTVHDYLFQLRLLAHCLQPLGAAALYYLAAAVSDFHIPPSRMTEHKIQSEGGGSTLTIIMDPVPKFLRHLVEKWAPSATIISFKVSPSVNEQLLIIVGNGFGNPNSKGERFTD
jgi:phosphopantothenate---cysteine ligase (ATP)